jgi:hypothetical protein
MEFCKGSRDLVHISEKKLRVSENRVLRRVFGSKRDEDTGGWKRLDGEELRILRQEQVVCSS